MEELFYLEKNALFLGKYEIFEIYYNYLIKLNYINNYL